MASVTAMLSSLNWETLEKCCCEKPHLCMLYKVINSVVEIPMYHCLCFLYQSTFTRSFHSQNLLYPVVELTYTNIHFPHNN